MTTATTLAGWVLIFGGWLLLSLVGALLWGAFVSRNAAERAAEHSDQHVRHPPGGALGGDELGRYRAEKQARVERAMARYEARRR